MQQNLKDIKHIEMLLDTHEKTLEYVVIQID